MTKIEKNKFSYLHFILNILVILIHSINNNTKFELFFSDNIGIGQFAVPLFFIISGFLFFRNTININDLKNKLISRFFSLLIPYFLWNFIYYIFHFIIEPDTSFNLTILIDAIINYTYNPVFWFIYQLILLTTLSPLIFFITNLKLDIPFLVIFSIIIILNIDFPFINEDAIIYYAFGAYLSTLFRQKKITIIKKQNIILPLLISIVLLYINYLLHKRIFSNLMILPYYTLSIIYLRISISMIIFYIIDILSSYKKIPLFMQNTFFLYSIHYMIVRFIIILTNENIINYFDTYTFKYIQIAMFILTPITCVVTNYFLSILMKKMIPKTYNILTGHRK